ncbi:hypothetical protein [Blastomonas fulva]|uniref:hypothetical protein n=1 Tax=Blastomonas fulva TaxID=1550728 RepID=UPI003F71EB48
MNGQLQAGTASSLRVLHSRVVAPTSHAFQEGPIMAKGLILWLLGVPGLLIIALFVFGIL